MILQLVILLIQPYASSLVLYNYLIKATTRREKHYLRNGTVHNGVMHKMANGTLHTGKTHTKTSKPLFHMRELSKTAQAKARRS